MDLSDYPFFSLSMSCFMGPVNQTLSKACGCILLSGTSWQVTPWLPEKCYAVGRAAPHVEIIQKNSLLSNCIQRKWWQEHFLKNGKRLSDWLFYKCRLWYVLCERRSLNCQDARLLLSTPAHSWSELACVRLFISVCTSQPVGNWEVNPILTMCHKQTGVNMFF